VIGRRQLLIAGAIGALAGQSGDQDSRGRGEPARRQLASVVATGDLVFRTGGSIESLAVRTASYGADYSHVGVAVRTAEGLRIIHALPPEGDDHAGVIASTWADYALADDVQSVALYRIRGLTVDGGARMANAALNLLGRPFNRAFVLDEAHGLYCTQVALHAVCAVDPSVVGSIAPTAIPMLSEPVYLPSTLAHWPRLARVA